MPDPLNMPPVMTAFCVSKRIFDKNYGFLDYLRVLHKSKRIVLEEFKQQLTEAEQFNCEADFMLRVYRKQI